MKTKTVDLVPELEYAFEFAHKYFSSDSVDAYLAVKICAALHEFATQQVTAATEEIKRERDEYYDTLQEYRLKTADMEKRIQELEAQVPKWISVEERLPKIGVSVLMLGPSIDIQVGFYIGNDRWDTFYQKRLISITHWMPLPKPLK